MQILWLEEKTETEWGIFRPGDLIDTKLCGIPDEHVYPMVTRGSVELINSEDDPPAQKWWDKEKGNLVPVSEKPKPTEEKAERKLNKKR